MNRLAVFGCLMVSAAALRAEIPATAAEPANWESPGGTPSEQLNAIIDASSRFESSGDLPSAIKSTAAALQRIGRAHYRRRELEQRLIDLHIRAGTLDALIADTTSATGVASTAVASWKLLAEIFRLQGKHDQRRQALRAAWQLTPTDEGVAMELAEIESSLGDHAAATEIVENALKRRPNDVEWTLIFAKVKVREQSLDQAEASLNTLISTDQDDDFLRNRVASFYQSNRMTEALRRLVLTDDAEKNFTGLKTAALLGNQDPELLFALADSAIAADGENSLSAGELAKLAEAINQAGSPTRAMELLKHANQSNPADPDILRVLLTLSAQSGDLESAFQDAEEAIAVNPSLAATLDYQVFQLLGSASPHGSSEMDTPDSLVSGLMNSMKPGGYFGGEIKRREAQFQRDWEKSKSPLDALRLARWQSWRGEPEAAAATLRLALGDTPENIPLLELRLELALKSGDRTTALELVEQLQALQPQQTTTWKSKSAAILMDQDQFEAAVDVYQSLADESPSNPETWMNLASAQQRAGNYFGALDSWMIAFATADDAGKTQIRTPILAVIERLKLWEKGVEFLSDYAASQLDEATAVEAYEQAIAFAIQHDSLSDLRERWISQESKSGTSTSMIIAKAALATATDDNQEALNLLAIASAQATNKVLVWRRLLEAAVASNDHERALMAASAIIAEDDSAKSWIQLARTQEAAAAKSDAAATWQVIKHRFNRDPEALEAAAAFFDRNGDTDQAAAARLAAAHIDGASPATIFHAIEISLGSGDRALAITLCDRLLAQTTPLTATNLSLPGASENDPTAERQSFTIAMQAMGGLNDPDSVAALRKTGEAPSTDTADTIRLRAIQTRARLSQDGAERETWSSWCKTSTSPTETVWAWYAMNQYAEALDVIESSDAGQLPPESEQSFAWIALKGDQMERLREWIDQSAEDRRRRSEFVFMALSRLLLTTPPPTDRLGVLFPLTKETISERWQAAWMLAAHGHFNPAVEFASPALDVTPPNLIATGAQTLASWNLVLLDTPGALGALRYVKSCDGSSLDQPAFHAWRMRWLLESEEGREAMEQEADRSEDAVFKAGTTALAAALRNDAEATRLAAENLMSLWTSLTPTIVLENSLDATIRTSVGMALTAKLPVLAFELTRATGQLDLTQTALQDGMASPANQDTLLLSLLAQLQCAPPAQAAYQLAQSSPPLLDAPTLTSLYRQLDASGHPAASAAVLSEILRSHPTDITSLNEIAFAARRKGDLQTESKMLEVMLAALPESKHFPTFADASLRLSDIYIQVL
ncbi:MAG: tetratricopeptide repeat protein, partial [Chthoniobacterales bacterium]